MNKFSTILLVAVVVFLLVPIQSSQAVDYLPIVQCGRAIDDPATSNDETKPCTTCDFFKMAKNTIDLILYALTPALATFFFIWAGFLMLIAGASPGWYGKGKGIFTNTIWGVVIVLLAWVVANTFIQFFYPANVASSWWQFQCPAGLP